MELSGHGPGPAKVPEASGQCSGSDIWVVYANPGAGLDDPGGSPTTQDIL